MREGGPRRSTGAGEHELAQQLGDLVRSLPAETDADAVLGEIVSAAVRLIPGVDQGSISVVQGRQNVGSYGASGIFLSASMPSRRSCGRAPAWDVSGTDCSGPGHGPRAAVAEVRAAGRGGGG